MNKNEFNINMLSKAHEEVGKLKYVSSITKGEIQVLIGRVQESLITQSAGIMPKFFDKWIKNLRTDPSWTNYAILNELSNLFFDDMFHDKNESDIYYWLIGDDDKKDASKYVMCIDAIINGYEVED